MNKQTQILTNPAQQPTGGNDAFNEIDLGKILGILRRSFIWIIFLNALTILGAYTYLRYYKPIYESSSSLKLTIKNQSSLQGIYGILGTSNDDNLKQLAGEIEFIRSDIIIDEIIRKLNLGISYHTQGNFLDSEIYPHSPFEIEAEVLNPAFCNQKIFVRFPNEKTCKLSYLRGEQEYQQEFRIGKTITTPDFKLKVNFRMAYQKEMSAQNYFFVVYSKPALQANLRKNLKVGITKPEARIIDISFTDHTPTKAQHIVAAIDSAYMEKSVEEKNKSNRQQIAFLNDQLKQFEDSLILYESQIQNFFLENKTKNIDNKLEKSIQNIETLVTDKQKLAKKLSLLRELELLVVQEAPLKDFIPLVPFLENDNIAQQIQAFYKRIEDRELLGLQENVDKNNTYRAKKLNMQMQLDREALLELVMANKKLIYEQLSEANARLVEVENSLIGLPSKGREFNRINRLYNQFDQYYASLLNKRTEIKIAEAGIVPEFIILSPASLPQIPIAPVKFQFYAIAGALGFFLSLALVAGRYLAHNTITNQAELERLVSAPVLGIIPEYRKTKLKHTKLVVSQNPKSSINEALRSVRTNLDYMLPSGKGLYSAEGCIVLSITSTISGEGKTFVASNLGGIIAMANLKVIILDFDMRKPKLHLAFNAENQQGVSSILIGKKPIEECIQPTEITNLFFISSGPTPPNPSELILREDFEMLIDSLRPQFDIIIIDTPPVGLVTDGILIMQNVDVPIYVLKANYSKKIFTKNINRLIQTNNFSNLAVILNAVKKTRSGYGYGGYGYGGYGYGGYGYGGYYEDEKEGRWAKIWKKLFKKADKTI